MPEEKTVDVQFHSGQVYVEGCGSNKAYLEITAAVLQEIVESIGTDVLLDAIGEKAALDHFGIESARHNPRRD